MDSRISSKGQITVPLAVRDRLGLPPGTPVTFELIEGGAILRKGRANDHPVDRVFGRVRLGKPVDRFLDEMRGPRPTPGPGPSGRPKTTKRAAR
jgi:AbrB family looped-hinge helix DNA binding protein